MKQPPERFKVELIVAEKTAFALALIVDIVSLCESSGVTLPEPIRRFVASSTTEAAP